MLFVDVFVVVLETIEFIAAEEIDVPDCITLLLPHLSLSDQNTPTTFTPVCLFYWDLQISRWSHSVKCNFIKSLQQNTKALRVEYESVR